MSNLPSIPVELICTCVIVLEKHVRFVVIKYLTMISFRSMLNDAKRVTSGVSKNYVISMIVRCPCNSNKFL